jgi:hypothetical protein
VLLVMGTALLAARISQPAQPPPAVDIANATEAQLAAAALRLNSQGVGTQVAAGMALTFKMEPPAPKAGEVMTLHLIPLNVQTQAVTPVSPTLTSGLIGSTSAATHAFVLQPDGTYIARGDFFPTAGRWRVRTVTTLNGLPGFVTMIDVEVK